MSTRTDAMNAMNVMDAMGSMGSTAAVETYAHLWQGPPYPRRWVLWDTAGDVVVFDRDTNCPVDIDDGAVRREVLRRMREAGVPEGDDYPGHPCA